MKGKRVVIVEPNELLREQTAEKLLQVDASITVTSIERLYTEGPWSEIIILDEYDLIVSKSSYFVQQVNILGLWQLRGKRVFAFSATSSASYERFVSNVIMQPKVLKFKSEYEYVHGTSPVVDPAVVATTDKNSLFQAITADLEKHFDQHPVIIIAEGEVRE